MNNKFINPEHIKSLNEETKIIVVSSPDMPPNLASELKHELCGHCPWCEGIVCHPDNETECFGNGCYR